MNKIILEMEKLCADILSPANEHDTDIILFGAGRHMHGYVFQFEFVSQFLKKNGAHLSCSFIDRVSAVIDNSPRKQGGGEPIADKKFTITSPAQEIRKATKQIKNNKKKQFIIIITATRYAKEMESDIHAYDVPPNISYVVASELSCDIVKGRWPRKFFRQLMRDWADQYTYADIPSLVDKLFSWLKNDLTVVPEMGMKLTQKCTLNCRNCIDRVPFMEKKDVPFDMVDKDLDLLIENCDDIGRLTFVTGETLVYPQLAKVLEKTVNNPKLHQIFFNTNGTVLPSDACVPYLQSEKCLIHISDYGDIVRMARAVDFYERHDIAFFISSEMTWKNVGRYPKARHLDVEHLKKEYASCGVGNACPPIFTDGKLFPCAIACWFHGMGEYKGTRDYAELKNISKEEFRHRLYTIMDTDYLESCDMCDVSVYGNLPQNIDAGVQIDSKKQWHRSKYTICPRM